MGGQPQAWTVAPQPPVGSQIICCLYSSELWLQGDQEIARGAPLHEAVAPSNFEIQTAAAPDQAQVLDMSVPERLRRLAERYVNDPESVVNGVHLESGPSGRFQVVITIKIGDILGDTID